MLAELIDDALSLAFRFLASADFSDRRRLADLLLEYRNDLDSSIAPSGHQYAVSRAACVTGRSRAVDEIWNGLAQVDFVRKQSAHIRNAAFASDLIARLDRIRGQLTAAGMVVNLTGSPDVLDAMQSAVARRADGFALRAPLDAASLPDGSAFRDRAALLALARDSVFGHDSREGGSSSGTPTTTAKAASLELIASAVQVGFAAAVLPSPRYGTPEQPVDIVLGHWLASGPLWEKIRTTGGAYGVFAYPDSLEDIFVFSTYRDPQPLQALKTFRDTLEAVARDAIDPISLEKAITGCYSREIQPRAPADKGFTAFIRVLYGISDDLRLAKLRRMLELSPVDISLAAQRLLSDLDVAHCAVLAGKKQLKGADKAEFPGNVTRYTV
jgi:Zn-dependent M16 (insulinase) family peptidase